MISGIRKKIRLGDVLISEGKITQESFLVILLLI